MSNFKPSVNIVPRMLTSRSSPSVKDHKAMIHKVYDNLAPGGWAEFHEWACEFVGADDEADQELRSSALWEWMERVIAWAVANGKKVRPAKNYKAWMIEAGFVDVVEKQILHPISPWPLDPRDRELGGWASLDLLKLIPATTKMILASGMPLEEIPAFQERVCEALTRRTMRVYSICK